MTPEQALIAATYGSAKALEVRKNMARFIRVSAQIS